MYYRQLARKLRNNTPKPEKLLWQYLRRKQMGNYKFRRQHPIGKYIVDFICLEAGLVVELDGGQHNEQKHTEADLKRTAWLESQGLKVLRFWNTDVLNRMPVVVEVIWNALNIDVGIDHPLPNPPPCRGRGTTP